MFFFPFSPGSREVFVVLNLWPRPFHLSPFFVSSPLEAFSSLLGGKGFMYLIDGRGQHCLKSLNVDLFERLVDESVAMADAKIGVLTPEGLTERVNPIKE